ncbi:MAG: M23 family metallopeptidase, partial [bacterium]
TTLYAHLRGFAAGVAAGARVRQGDVIGYVGSTGWATGAHLHYEFRVNGTHRNPLTVDLPSSAPVAASQQVEFLRRAETLAAELDRIGAGALAKLEPA